MNLLKQLILVGTIVIFCGTIMQAQCPSEDIHLKTQTEVDNFVVLYPNCTELTGSLRIGDAQSANSDIADLSPLSQITYVGYDLRIYNNDSLMNLTGLENLTSVWGYLNIDNNNNLTTLNGLNNLTTVGDLNIDDNDGLINLSGLDSFIAAQNFYLFIRNNDNLVSLDGLESLAVGVFHLIIKNNDNLTDLTGLENLMYVLGYMDINYNDNLISLNGLDNLVSIESDLWIYNNDNLTTLNGLDNLASITGNLSIYDNGNLTTLNGLESLVSTNRLYIYSNHSLLSLEALESLIEIEANPLWAPVQIYDNQLLSTCYIPIICDYLENDGYSKIHDNAPNCNSPEEIINICTVSTTTPDNLPQIIISPNPTNGIFTLQNIPTGTYQIHHTSGQIIQEGSVQNDLLIDISRQAQGVYFISVTVDDTTSVRRIVKM